MRSMVPAKKDPHNLLALSVLFLIVLFLTSCHTSPLYPDYFGADSAIFALIGKGMTEGKTLYADLGTGIRGRRKSRPCADS